jgi:hemolysin activation/secretion protein
LPGVEARAVLEPSTTKSGASQVVVNIKRRTLEGSSFLVNNRGTRFLGPVQATAVLAANNIIGLDEQTSVRLTNTIFYPDELKYFGVHHEQQIGSYGTKVLLDGNYVTTNPGYTLEPFDVKGQNYLVGVGLSHPIIRSRQTNWFVNTDFSVQRINLDVLDTNLYLDKLRVLKTGSAYDFVDSTNAVNRIEANLSKGFNWDTGNDGLAHSRANGKADFWKSTGNITRIQPVYGAFSLSASVDGQYSSAPLYAAEEYSLGGPQFGSAFDPSELSGDAGVAGRLELQYNGVSEGKFMSSYQPYVFYDIGKVWNRNVIGASELKEASLSSAGIGSRFNINESLTGSMELAFPLTQSVSASGRDGDSQRLFFNLQYRY